MHGIAVSAWRFQGFACRRAPAQRGVALALITPSFIDMDGTGATAPLRKHGHFNGVPDRGRWWCVIWRNSGSIFWRGLPWGSLRAGAAGP